MKRIFIFLAPAILAVAVYGCSKDHESPTFSKYESILKAPVNLVATYSSTTKKFILNWEMPDTNAVKMYVVAWSDSNVFDLGHKRDEITNSLTTADTLDALNTIKALGYSNPPDSFIVYFTVQALYDNATFNQFKGPQSVVDSTLYKK